MNTQSWIDLITGLDMSAGPYPTVVGLGERALLTAVLMWLAVGVRARQEVTG
jgi:hypothetical protein